MILKEKLAVLSNTMAETNNAALLPHAPTQSRNIVFASTEPFLGKSKNQTFGKYAKGLTS